MSFEIIRNDITKVAADAIVNTANPRPVVGGGTDSAVYLAAGRLRLLAARKKIGDIAPGQAVSTPAFRLSAKYIIHTVGPIWQDGTQGERETLRQCYANSLSLAESLGCESVAFPLISTGSYGFPKEEGLRIALEEIGRFLLLHEMRVILVVFDRSAVALSTELVGEIDQYIDDHTARELRRQEYRGENRTTCPSKKNDLRFMRSAATDAAPAKAKRRSRLPEKRDDRRRGKRSDAFPEEEDLSEGFSPEECLSADGFPSEAFFNVCQREDAAFPEPAREKDDLPAEAPSWDDDMFLPSPSRDAETLYDACPSAAAPMQTFAFREPERQDSLPDISGKSLEEVVGDPGQTFQQKLFALIDASGMDDVTVYKKANVDRKVFSRIRCTEDYRPKKKTAVAFAIALELDMPTMLDLLSRAEIALSPSSKFDLIVMYFVSHHIYDIFEINAALFKYGQPILGE